MIVNIYVKMICKLDNIIVVIIFGFRDSYVILDEEWVNLKQLVLEDIIVMIKDMWVLLYYYLVLFKMNFL